MKNHAFSKFQLSPDPKLVPPPPDDWLKKGELRNCEEKKIVSGIENGVLDIPSRV
jgi:hypothetical protein